jgi:hypothetical protein
LSSLIIENRLVACKVSGINRKGRLCLAAFFLVPTSILADPVGKHANFEAAFSL